MSPARKGGGTGLSFQGYSEVRSGDGTVLWSAIDIPDSDDLHARHDFSELDEGTTSNVPDLTDNGHDLDDGSFTGVDVTINGVQAGEFDGTDDYLASTFANLGQPNHYFVAFQLQSDSGERIVSSNSTDDRNNLEATSDSDWLGFAGTPIDGGAVDTDPHILTALFDGTDSYIRIDGVEVASGDPGDEEMGGGLTIAAKEEQSDFGELYMGEVLVYPEDKTNVESEVESYLSNKWNISLS